MAKQPPEVVGLAQKLLKAAGKQNPVTLMNALLLCMQLIDATTHGPRKVCAGRTAHNAELRGRPLADGPG